MLVADDQPLFCSGLQLLIDAQPDLKYVGAAHSGSAAVRESARLHPDIVLMDLRMPDGNGVTATREILRMPAAPHVLVLTTFRDTASARLAMNAGASGVLTKDATPGRLIGAIRDVLAGRPVLATSASTPMLSDPVPAHAPDLAAIAGLTPREREVFLHAARGLSNPEIARLAHISENTVRTHVSAILGKLRLENRHELIHFAHRHGLLPLL
ncbi:response regulator [Amnibacterium endophyticum]|uniref:Response regulator n=1 Tax=Amnibacterium endophyticum TaxID=2109337 RepID=A0ABW4LG48_9MICO